MHRPLIRLAGLTLVVACQAGLSGCSGDDDALPMSPSDVEVFVETSWNADADDFLRIDSVQCDDGLENKLGDRASCSLTMTDDSQSAGTLEVFVVENDKGDLVPTYITGEPSVGPPGIDLFD